MRPLLVALFLIPSVYCSASVTKADSMEQQLATAKEDTNKAILLFKLCWEYRKINTAKAITYGKQALELSEQLGFRRGIGASYNNLGGAYEVQGDYSKAVDLYLRSLKIKEELNDKKGMAGTLNNLGIIHKNQNNYSEALKYYERALNLNRETGNKLWIGKNLYNIGVVYRIMKQYDMALEHQLKSLAIYEELNNREDMANSYQALGNIYKDQGNRIKALEFYLKALAFVREFNDKHGESTLYDNIGTVFLNDSLPDEAITNFEKALLLARAVGSKVATARTLDNLGSAYEMRYRFSRKAADLERALRYYREFFYVRDSVVNEEATMQVAEMQAKYDAEKKDREILLQEAEIQKGRAEAEKRNVLLTAFITGFVLVLVLAFYIYSSYRQKQKANIEISMQKQVIEEKNKSITDSITYARRIQSSLLPSEKYIERSLNRLMKK
ncbi:MAG: tetratricopeptide repeat protein [Bacteroidota bacterium]